MSILTSCPGGLTIEATNTGYNEIESVRFTTSYALPPGCAISSQELSWTINGETFGPFADPSFPFIFGPLTLAPNAGISFTVAGSIDDHTLTPDAAMSSLPVTVTETYTATGSICGSDTSVANADIEPEPIPVRGFTGSDDSTYDAIIISTGGSLAQDLVTDISDDPTAVYLDEFNIGACGSEVAVLFEITGAAGTAISSGVFQNWNASLDAANKTAIVAAFSGQIGDANGAGGYTFDKELVRDELVDAGILNDSGNVDGDDWCIHGFVTHNLETSNEAQYSVQEFREWLEAVVSMVGFSGPFDPAGTSTISHFGVAYSGTSLSGAGGTLLTNSNSMQLDYSTIAAAATLDNVLNIDTISNYASGNSVNAYQAYEEIHFISGRFELLNGLQAYGNFWGTIHDNPNGTNPDFGQNGRLQGINPTYWQTSAESGSVPYGSIRFRGLFSSINTSGGANPDSINGDLIDYTDVTYEARRYDIGVSGLVVSGTENPDPALASASPMTATLDPAGDLVAVTDEAVGGTMLIILTPTESGDIYFRIAGAGINTGLPYELVGSGRFKII